MLDNVAGGAFETCSLILRSQVADHPELSVRLGLSSPSGERHHDTVLQDSNCRRTDQVLITRKS